MIELSERLVSEDLRQQENIEALTGLGVVLSLDDFGEGRTSLAHLRGLPIKQLKIDRRLVQNACDSQVDRTILRSITKLARDLSMVVVAEGIENRDQQDVVAAMGVELLQGYGLFRPLGAEQLARLLQSGATPPPLRADRAAGPRPPPSPSPTPSPSPSPSPTPSLGPSPMLTPAPSLASSPMLTPTAIPCRSTRRPDRWLVVSKTSSWYRRRRPRPSGRPGSIAPRPEPSPPPSRPCWWQRWWSADRTMRWEPRARLPDRPWAAGTVALTDDDEGRTLFDLRNLAPGRPLERCILVTYEGTILPVDLVLLIDAPGGLAPFLDVSIEQGTGGGFDSCDGFEAESRPYVGSLRALHDRSRMELGDFVNQGQSRRVTGSGSSCRIGPRRWGRPRRSTWSGRSRRDQADRTTDLGDRGFPRARRRRPASAASTADRRRDRGVAGLRRTVLATGPWAADHGPPSPMPRSSRPTGWARRRSTSRSGHRRRCWPPTISLPATGSPASSR